MILKVENVGKNFGGLQALCNVSFELEEGKILGLIGPNGSGKTTLFNCITGFYKPSTGKVTFNGKDITGFSPSRVCKEGITRTFQLNKPFAHLTVLENVMIGRLNGAKPSYHLQQAAEESMEIIEFTGMKNKAQVKAGMLGIVDRKRVEVARALATRPKLILFDEMMAGMNLKEIEDAMVLVKKIREMDITIILVEHVMKAVLGISDWVVVLNAGDKIVECAPNEVFECKEVIESYLGEGHASN